MPMSIQRGSSARMANHGLCDAQNVCTLTIPKPYKIVKNETFFCLQASNLAPKLGHRRPEWQLACSLSSVARQDSSCVILNEIRLLAVCFSLEIRQGL